MLRLPLHGFTAYRLLRLYCLRMAAKEPASEPSGDDGESHVLRKSYEYQLKEEQDNEEEPHAETDAETATHLQDKSHKQGYVPSNGCQETLSTQKAAWKKVRHKLARHKRRKRRKDEATVQETVEEMEVHKTSTTVDIDVLNSGPEADDNQEAEIILTPEKLEQKSVSSGKLYVEEGYRFRAIDYTRNEDLVLRKREHTPLETALTLQRAFCRLATFCQGILAGVALWQCLVPFQLDRVYDALLYLLTVVCLIQALDSMDIASWRVRKRANISPLVVVLIYVVLLLLHLGTSTYTDKSCTAQPLAKVKHSQWVNIGHCIGALLGWGLVAFSSPEQHMLRHLQEVNY
ncbi:transmembrane protein 237-like [Ornithodoros turicata]|uniref:transmembrane protein 237-like n=1 Tax=Ornithodoros turicata TaxID=34597 RepID=UPI00313907DC